MRHRTNRTLSWTLALNLKGRKFSAYLHTDKLNPDSRGQVEHHHSLQVSSIHRFDSEIDN